MAINGNLHLVFDGVPAQFPVGIYTVQWTPNFGGGVIPRRIFDGFADFAIFLTKLRLNLSDADIRERLRDLLTFHVTEVPEVWLKPEEAIRFGLAIR